MNIIVNSDRTVEKEYTEKDGSQNENRVTELNFTLPEEYSGEGFVPKIAFITEDGNFSDYIDNGKYILKNNITKYREVICFVWLTNSVNNIDFRSQTFPLEFYYNEDPSDYIPSEQEKSQIELLMEELEEKIQEVTELEENVYTKDETYSKEEVDEIIPTDISDLNNDSGFIDKDVNNLTNYYKKSETYTKQEIDGKISSVYKYKGTVASYNNLPSTGLTIGDVYNVEDTGDNYAWTGTDWDKLGGNIDLSGYQEKIDNSHKLNADLVDDTSTTHKFTSTSEKNSWNAKYDKPSGGIPKTDLSEKVKEDLEKADEALDQIETIEEDLYGNIDVEAEESSIKLSGTKDGRDVSIKKIYGNSTQVQYSGKNKWSLGNISINGTYENSTSLLLGEIYFETGNYTINLSKELINSSYLYIGPSGSIATNIIKQSTFSVSEAGSYAVRCVRQSGIYNDFEALVQLEQGSTATNYEPYVGGTASPNPTYKQDINNVEGDVVVKGKNRQLFDKDNANILNGYFTPSDTTFVTNYAHRSVYIPCKSNTTYTVQKIATSRFRVGFTDILPANGVTITNSMPSSTNGENLTEVTVTSGANSKYLIAWVSNTNATSEPYMNNILNSLQIVEGSTAKPYTAYAENTVTFPLSQGQKLMLGDTLENDGIHHKRGQIVLDGTENWVDYTTQIEGYYKAYCTTKKTTALFGILTGLCTHFKIADVSLTATQAKNLLGSNQYALYISISNNVASNVTELKTYLAEQYANGTPVIVEYELATETTEAYTSAQQTAYDNLQKMQQYEDITYLSVSSTEVVSQFDISYDGDRIEVLLNDVSNLKIGKEDKSNKKSELNNNLTNDDYLGAKVVYDALQEKQTQIDNLKAENEQLWNDHPDILDENNEFPSGTDLTLNGTGDLEMSVDVGGNSTQESTTGKNWLDLSGFISREVNGLTFSYQNGKLKINGTANALIDVYIGNSTWNANADTLKSILNAKNTTYYLSSTSNKISNYYWSTTNGYVENSVTTTDSNKISTIFVRIANGTTFNNELIGFQIEENSSATSWEKYTGGTASPNPSYKQDINNVEGNVVAKAESKNKLDYTENFEQTSNGIIYKGSNGVYNINGVSTGGSDTSIYSIKNYTIKSDDYVHVCNNSINLNVAIALKCSDNTVISIASTIINRIYSLNNYIGKTITGIYFHTNSGITVNNLILSPMILNNVSTVTDFVIHKENTVTFPLSQGQKLMLGDTLEDDGIHHVRGQYVFTGNENWNKSGNTTSTSFCCYTSDITPAPKISKSSSDILSGKLNIGQVTIVDYINNYETCFAYNQNSSMFLKIANSAIPNWNDNATDSEKIALFKNYLAQQYANNTPVIVEYELETETTEAYTSAQQTAYNKLKEMQSYYDLTYVTGSSDNAQPILTAHAKKSIKQLSGGDLSNYQTKITSTNKLNSDLVNDTNQTNKFVTSTEKNTWNSKQNATDNNLATTNKTITGAINEVNSIAKGANQAISYTSYSAMVTAINALASTALNVGQNIYIETLEVPDLWVYKVESTSSSYTYTTDEAITTALETTGYIQVGYYKLSALETQKVDLTNYVENTDYANATTGGVVKISILTQSEYNELQTIDTNTFYMIKEEVLE